MVHITATIIGAGFQGGNLARALHNGGTVDVTHISDPHPERAEPLAREVGARAVSSISEALDADVVVIATPNDRHAELARTALAAGRRVFVEKPAALGAHGIDSLAVAAAHGQLIVGHSLRTAEGVRRLIETARGGDIGQLRRIHATRTRFAVPGTGWKHEPARSGGELYHEIHELDLLCMIGGDISARWTAADQTADREVDRASWRESSIRFANGAAGRHALDTRSHRPSWTVDVFGATGTVSADLRRGVVELHREGVVADSWPVFSDTEANAALIASATPVSTFNRAGAPPSAWMQRLAANVATEIERFARGAQTILHERPLDAVTLAHDILRSQQP